MSERDERVGKLLLEHGLLSPEEYEDAEAARKESNRPLSELLVEKNYLSEVQIQDALATLDKRVRFCQRCNMQVFVPRMMAEGERCPRCLHKIQWQEESFVAKVKDLESLVQLTRDELPADVQAARRMPGRLLGKYILVRELGHGGAGVVQMAWDTMLGEYVALKFIRELKDEDGAEPETKRNRQERILDLLQEARATLRLRHEHIVGVRDIGRIDDQFFIAMDYIDGRTLADLIRQSQARGRLSPLYEDPVFHLSSLRNVSNARQDLLRGRVGLAKGPGCHEERDDGGADLRGG